MIKLRKCKFFEADILFLRHIVGRHRLKPDPEKIDILIDLINLTL